MRIAVCDDIPDFLYMMKEYLFNMRDMVKGELEVFTYNTGEDLMYDIETGSVFNAVFLDINLGSTNGIELAKRIYDMHPATMIAFMTAHHNFIEEVFEVQPCGFIDKPIRHDNLVKILELIVRKCDDIPKFDYSINRVKYYSMLNDIVCIRSSGHKIFINELKKTIEYYGKLDEADEKLQKISSNFIRVSKSDIINVKYVKQIKYDKVILTRGEEEIPINISQKYRQDVRRRIMEMNRN